MAVDLQTEAATQAFAEKFPNAPETAWLVFKAGWDARSSYEYELDLALGQAQADLRELNKLKTSGCPISDQVISKIRDRAQQGISKYGSNMMQADRPILEWLMETQEEAMDMAVYLQRIIISIAQEQKGTGDDQ